MFDDITGPNGVAINSHGFILVVTTAPLPRSAAIRRDPPLSIDGSMAWKGGGTYQGRPPEATVKKQR